MHNMVRNKHWDYTYLHECRSVCACALVDVYVGVHMYTHTRLCIKRGR